MKTFASCSRALVTVGSVLLGATPGVLAADLVLQKVPPLTVEQAPAYPENLARRHLGARVESASGVNATDLKAIESALLSGDPTARYDLRSGKTTVLVALRKIENVNSISFVNRGVKGSVSVATSNSNLPANSPQWQTALQQELSADGLQAKVGPSEAKYVRVTFDVSEPGQIAGFGIYASPQVSDFTAPRTRQNASDKSGSFGLISYSHTDMHAKARALYVSSGSDVKQANNMIDDQTATTYTFAAQDGTPTTVIDLGKPVSLRRLSAVYGPEAGNMEFFVLQALPGEGMAQASAPGADGDPVPTPENAPNTVTLNDAAFAGLKAVGRATDDGSQGRASVEFPATSGRYVMVRWTPAAQSNSSFSLAEIAAFGPSSPTGTLLAANTDTSGDVQSADSTMESSDGKTMIEGKTMIDPKDMPGEGPAEGPPPTLPQPPPFTFVPVLNPNSP